MPLLSIMLHSTLLYDSSLELNYSQLTIYKLAVYITAKPSILPTIYKTAVPGAVSEIRIMRSRLKRTRMI